jgi:predicted GNAT family acetyltransferase
VLGELTREQCFEIADATRDFNYPGVVGPAETAASFVERASIWGLRFDRAIPQQIQALRARPDYPNVPGEGRLIRADDIELFVVWTSAFLAEAVPHDPRPGRGQLEKSAVENRFRFWIVNDQPVSMGGIVRRTRHAAAIGAVYTPPHFRGRGYAGAIAASLVDQIFAEGKSTACLYTDLRNPYSNRCYAKIGFKPVCLSRHYVKSSLARSP